MIKCKLFLGGYKVIFDKLKAWAKQLKRKIFILFFAYKHNHTPWYAKVFAVCVVAYAFSPIDLIPDFIFPF